MRKLSLGNFFFQLPKFKRPIFPFVKNFFHTLWFCSEWTFKAMIKVTAINEQPSWESHLRETATELPGYYRSRIWASLSLGPQMSSQLDLFCCQIPQSLRILSLPHCCTEITEMLRYTWWGQHWLYLLTKFPYQNDLLCSLPLHVRRYLDTH